MSACGSSLPAWGESNHWNANRLRERAAIARSPRLLLLYLGAIALIVLGGCAPRLTTTSGVAYTGAVPASPLVGHRMLIFRWEYRDETVSRGEGTVRIAAPDSARVDLFLAGGFGSGHAVLIGNGPVRAAAAESLTDILPAAPVLWAAVGRLAVPAAADTAMRIMNQRLTVDIGAGEVWRATFEDGRLSRLEHALNRRLVEVVTRGVDGAVTYTRGSRILRITEVREVNAEPFDPDIWRF